MINLVNIAAGTTVAVNLLTIKDTIKKVKTASHGVVVGTKKTGKKVKKVVVGH